MIKATSGDDRSGGACVYLWVGEIRLCSGSVVVILSDCDRPTA